MVIKDVSLAFKKSGGTANENPNLSLGGDISLADPGSNFDDAVLHACFDEVDNDEAVAGDIEYRHCYFRNLKTFTLKNCKLICTKPATGPWSIVEFAKGTAGLNTIEQTIPDENTAPAGITDSDWFIPTSNNPMLFGELESDWTATFWIRRTVLPGALITDNETVSIRVFGDPPPQPSEPGGGEECPDGQHFDPDTELCVDDATPCPDGFELVDGICVPTECDEGFILVDGVCVPEGSPPSFQRVTVAIAGDFDCGSRANTVLAGVGALAEGGPEPVSGDFVTLDYFIANGDLSYDSDQDCFVELLDNYNLMPITKATIGNHDDTEDGNSSIRGETLALFGIPSGGYYSWDVGHVHFLAMDTQRSYSTSSAQYRFVAGDPNGSTQQLRDGDLKTAAQNPDIEWIIVYYHKPSMTPDSDHGPLTDFRNIYHPLFDTYHVDIIINGHNHNMCRSYPVRHNASSPSNPTVVSMGTNDIFQDVDGRVFVIAGAGGRSHHDINDNPNHYAFLNDSDYGFFYMHFVPDVNAVAGIHVTINGEQLEVLDSFALAKTL